MISYNPIKNIISYFLYTVVPRFIAIRYKICLIGKQNIPKKGGILLLSNHLSYLDAILIGSVFPRKLNFVAHEKYANMPIIGSFLKIFNTIPISPLKAKDSLKKILYCLERNKAVCLFPEGAISRNGLLLGMQKGTFFLAKKANKNCQIFTCAIHGIYSSRFAFSCENRRKWWEIFRRRKITIALSKSILRDDNFTKEHIFSEIINSSRTALEFHVKKNPNNNDSFIAEKWKTFSFHFSPRKFCFREEELNHPFFKIAHDFLSNNNLLSWNDFENSYLIMDGEKFLTLDKSKEFRKKYLGIFVFFTLKKAEQMSQENLDKIIKKHSKLSLYFGIYKEDGEILSISMPKPEKDIAEFIPYFHKKNSFGKLILATSVPLLSKRGKNPIFYLENTNLIVDENGFVIPIQK